MKVCLVSDRGDPEDSSTNLGHLCLAPVIENCGGSVELVEVSGLLPEHRLSADFVSEHILRHAPDIVGFTGMCDTYPNILAIAERCRAARPGTTIVLGGPQASATDIATLDCVPSVNMIVRGEGEATLDELLLILAARGDLSKVAGLTFRSNGRVIRNQDRPVISELDTLPVPAFHLQQYQAGVANVEAGRGCPFRCVYCSTSVHWQRRFRLKSPARIISEMRLLRDSYGVRTFCLVHDLFTVSRRAVIEFCSQLKAENLDVQWGCSARTDMLDDELLDVMASSGCVSLYFGIESGSATVQKFIGKNLDLTEAREVVTATARRGIRTSASFIVGFPEERPQDVRETLDFCVSLLPHNNIRLEMHHLQVLAGTELHQRYAERLAPPSTATNARLLPHRCHLPAEAASELPPLMHIERFAQLAFHAFRNSSMAVIRLTGGDVLAYYQRWVNAMTRCSLLPGGGDGVAASWIDAMLKYLMQEEEAVAWMRDLFRYEAARSSLRWQPCAFDVQPAPVRAEELFASRPVRNPISRFDEFQHDMAQVLSAVRTGDPHAAPEPVRSRVLFWMPSFAATLSRVLTDDAARFLELCTGERSGRDIIDSLRAGETRAIYESQEFWVEILKLFYDKRIVYPRSASTPATVEHTLQ